MEYGLSKEYSFGNEYSLSTPQKYSRGLIPGDAEVSPYSLGGLRRAVFLAIYVGIVAISFGGVIYSLYISPLLGIFGLLMAYLCNNIAFAITHVGFHAGFIELPESRMDVLLHHALIHHYRDTQVLHKTWLESRISYFVDPKEGIFSAIFLSMIPATLFVAWLLYRQHPILGITYFSTVWVAELLQSMIHEWYHNPVKNRKSFYNPVIYWVFSFLEKIGIASTKGHWQHHRHQLKNLNEVEKWLDLYLPLGELLPTLLWKKVLSRYVPGKVNMTSLVKKVMFLTFFTLPLLRSLSYLAVYSVLS